MFSEQAMEIMRKRYLRWYDGVQETPGEMFQRVADAIGKDDNERFQFYRIMADLDFLPNSPTLMNAGTPNGQLSACFVIPIEDSMDSIFDAVKDAAMIHKSGGGTGFSFSKLRPAGDMVGSTGGVASGPVSFMKVFNAATEAVKQGGARRGANMGVLACWHKDVEQFIHCKDVEGELANFNISVGITDDFMQAVENDELYHLINPRAQSISDTVFAKSLMRQIAESAWKTGEPGVIFLDAMNKDNPTPEYGEYEATNPCLAGDTWVYTPDGMRKIAWMMDAPEVLVDKRLGESRYQATGLSENGVRMLYTLQTREGYSLRLTSRHRVMTPRGWVEASKLNENEEIYIYTGEGGFGSRGTFNEGALLGWLVGDGYIQDEEAVIDFYAEKQYLAEYYKALVQSLPHSKVCKRGCVVGDKETLGSSELLRLAVRFGYGRENKVSITDSVMWASKEFQTGFIKALFTADGHVEAYEKSRNSVRLSSVSLTMLQDVQRMLLNFGIFSRIYRDSRGEQNKEMPDGKGGMKEYHCQACHILVITGSGINVFREHIGFMLPRKQALLDNIVEGYVRGPYKSGDAFVAHFDSLTEDKEEMVYDITEPVTHSFVANGIVVHNCGEQPLLPNESCNLGSINLANMVKDGHVDWDKLEATTKLATLFLDRVIDANHYPTEAIREATLRTRKIGLGVMGWADMLVKLGVPYDSDSALGLAEDVMHNIRMGAYSVSQERNATLTTIAPTGTLSIIAGVNSGIEPFFALEYERKNALGEGTFTNPLLAQYGANKELFKTSHEIPWQQHIRMQAAFQKYTDNAVSKTINMPNSATVEDIEAAYMMAWKLGCKGITVYRDKCRVNQVYNVGVKTEKTSKRERPEVTSGTTRKIRLGCERSLYVTVNNDDDGLCEVFAETGKAGGCIGSHTEGLARIISLALRSGVDVDTIVDQLSGIRCDRPKLGVLSCSDAIAKALSQSGGEEVYKPKVDVAPECPSCGGHVEMRDGCITCVDCGESRCG